MFELFRFTYQTDLSAKDFFIQQHTRVFNENVHTGTTDLTCSLVSYGLLYIHDVTSTKLLTCKKETNRFYLSWIFFEPQESLSKHICHYIKRHASFIEKSRIRLLPSFTVVILRFRDGERKVVLKKLIATVQNSLATVFTNMCISTLCTVNALR